MDECGAWSALHTFARIRLESIMDTGVCKNRSSARTEDDDSWCPRDELVVRFGIFSFMGRWYIR